jgi:hypothetical protein
MKKISKEVNSRPDVKEKMRQSKIGDKNPSKRVEVREKIKISINKPEIINHLREINIGKNNPRADLTIYKIKHKPTDIILIGTRCDISDQSKKLNLDNNNISVLELKNIKEFFRKNRKINSVKGWIKLEENICQI